jgi:cytochrome c-type biogenesis protein CcmH/NrfF
MKTHFAIIILTLFTLLFVTACSTSPATATTSSSTATSNEGAALVQERCTVCHSLSRVENARFTASDWKSVVDQMIARGARLTPDEETVVVSWLAANYGQ